MRQFSLSWVKRTGLLLIVPGTCLKYSSGTGTVATELEGWDEFFEEDEDRLISLILVNCGSLSF